MNENSCSASVLALRKEVFRLSRITFQRQVIVLRGSHSWQKSYIAHFSTNIENTAVVSASPSTYINFYNANPNQVVGKEFSLFIFHIEKNFDANLFTVCMGTIVGNGVLIIAISDDVISKKNHNSFTHRFIKQLSSNPHFHFISEENVSLSTKTNRTFQPDRNNYDEQKNAIEKIKHVVNGHRNRPLVLLANRGRGKSAALGIAAAELITEKLSNIIVTAPSFASAAVVFKHIKLDMPDHKQQGKSLTTSHGSIDFIAPDELLRTLPKTGLLLIDEAAAIPTPVLDKLLNNYSRIVFATTLHGYEGSGRGFELRFFQQLDKITPSWKKTKLTQPIRWADGDPLETFTNSTFLLDVETPEIDDKKNFHLNDCKIDFIPAATLANNESLLREIFSLLTVAHYRTKPSDLVQLLANPNSHIFISSYRNKVVATAFCLKEGSLNENLANEIYRGNRRPKGDLIPQALIFHAGLKEAAPLTCLRIVRIATHPLFRNRGIGTQLVESIINRAEYDKIDYLGVSFGATVELIRFWKKHAFTCLRVGLKRETSSNCHSLMLLRAISSKATIINQRAEAIFRDTFHHLLTDELRLLAPDIVHTLIYNFIGDDLISLSKSEVESLASFANENRSYEDNLLSLIKFTLLLLSNTQPTKEIADTDKFYLLIYKVLQKRDWLEIGKLTGLKGKQAIIHQMRTLVIDLPTS